METAQRIRNIGIFAHVDAGKTTLSERLLQHSGTIRDAGYVDSGTAHTDRLDIERRRGISVRSTCAAIMWRDVRIHLIDTPGHADFAAEVERSLWALDGAVLLLDAVEGVQPQARVLFDAFVKNAMPVILFINKTDREGADVARVVRQARALLGGRVVDITDDDQLHALLAEEDEAALEAYLEGRLYARERLLGGIRRMTAEAKAYPAWSGSALKDEGIAALLDAIVEFLPPPTGDRQGPLAGVVFAIEQDRLLGRAAHVRLFSGTIKNRDTVGLGADSRTPAFGQKATEAKVTQIRTVPLEGRGDDIGMLCAGEIGAVYGLGDVRVGQVLGDAAALPRRIATGMLGAPLLMVKAVARDSAQKNELRKALESLAAEDPLLDLQTLGNAPHVRVMGAVQLEVLSEIIASRFGVPTDFDTPNVIYRETIAAPAVGFYAYTMPKPCWAVIKFQIEPLPRGSGIEYESVVPAREIMPRYQHQIEQALPLALRQGMLGWQVDDVRITLIGGEHHLIHTHPLDFILATPVAFLDGLRRGGTVLLEPILSLDMTAPQEASGRLIREIVAMRGEVLQSQGLADTILMQAEVPLATSVDFSVRFASITGGRGAMSVRLKGYRDCDDQPPPECPRQGAHPLDTARYILAARNALGGGIFES